MWPFCTRYALSITVGLIGTVLAVPVRAQGAQQEEMWGEIALPGGATAARRAFSLGQPDGRFDAAWLLDYLRWAYRVPDAANIRVFEHYVATMRDLEAAFGTSPDGVALPDTRASSDARARTQAFVELLGFQLHEDNGRFRVMPDPRAPAGQRRAWLAVLDQDAAAVAETLNAGQPIVLTMTSTPLPLPLPDFWHREVFESNSGVAPIVAIARDRSLALLYCGLLALDEETLAFLNVRPELLRALRGSSAGAFAAFGRSLRVRGDAVDVPGGAAAVPIWQALVGVSPTEASPFIQQLFARDQGRLAYYYDAVERLDAARQRFVFGGAADETARIAAARGVFRAFATFRPSWSVVSRPFYRPSFDAASVLAHIGVLEDGTIGPAWWPALFARAVDGGAWPNLPDDMVPALRDQPADASWALQWIFASGTEAERFHLLRFAQRRFAASPRSAASGIEIALRSLRDMPALAPALERMGVTDPVVFAGVARAARRVTRGGSLALAVRWQAALALVEQVQRRRHLPEETIHELVTSLARALPDQLDRSGGAIADWIVERFLPAVLHPLPSNGIETAVVNAFAGVGGRTNATLSWEGLDYVVDDAVLVSRSVLAIRRARAGPRLDDLVWLHMARRAIDASPPAIEHVRSAAELASQADAGVTRLSTLTGNSAVATDLRVAASALRYLPPADLARAPREVAPIVRAIDAVTDVVVPALVYAFAVSPTVQSPEVFADAWQFHRSVPAVPNTPSVLWRLAQSDVRADGGQLQRGSLLSLDLVLAEALLVREPGVDLVVAPLLQEDAYETAVQSVALRDMRPFFAASDASSTLVALAAGRRQVQAWIAEPPEATRLREALRRAAVDEWRASFILWAARGDREAAFARLTPSELFRLGTDADLDARWAGSAFAWEGCVCALAPERRAPEDVRWQTGAQVPLLVTNLSLRLAEHLQAADLPSWLVPMMLPVAVQDWLDQVRQAGVDDWQAMIGWPNRVTAARVEDYLMRLVRDGILAPPDEDRQ